LFSSRSGILLGIFLGTLLPSPSKGDSTPNAYFPFPTVAPSAQIQKVLVLKGKPGSSLQTEAVPPGILARWGATLLDDQPGFAVLAVNRNQSPSLKRDLDPLFRSVEVRDDFDIVKFVSYPIDVRSSEPAYPAAWSKIAAFYPRDQFLIQFDTRPQGAWQDVIAGIGGTVLEYVPENAFIALLPTGSTKASLATLPIQAFSLLQSAHKLTRELQIATDDFLDVNVQIAAVPEADVAAAYLSENTLDVLMPPDYVVASTIYHDRVARAALPTLVAFPAVLWIELAARYEPSGEREAHLIAGGSLSYTDASQRLRPQNPGTYRTAFLNNAAISNYKTWTKVADLDVGFDVGSGSDVHPDFKNANNGSFVTVKNYMSDGTTDNGDCEGHGTLVAGVLAGNAGGSAYNTSTTGSGNWGCTGCTTDGHYLMGLGVAPGMPVVSGRIFTATCPLGTPNCVATSNHLSWLTIFQDLFMNQTAGITNNSWNAPGNSAYTLDAQTFDSSVRHLDGCDGYHLPPTNMNGNPCVAPGPPMRIFVSAGNVPLNSQVLTTYTPATAKNVISVGASENYNQTYYPNQPPLNPVDNLYDTGAYPALSGYGYCDNGKDVAQFSTTGFQGITGATRDRFKPDIVAPGTAIEGPRSRYTVPPALMCVGSVVADIDSNPVQHSWSRGTSFSSPAAAAAGALAETWYHNKTNLYPSPALIKAMLVGFAQDMFGGHHGNPSHPASFPLPHPPEIYQGFGRLSLSQLLTPTDHLWVDQTIMLSPAVPTWTSGPNAIYTIKDTTRPVKITLAWTDYRGFVNSVPFVVNNLDLSVANAALPTTYSIGNDIVQASGHSKVYCSGCGTNPIYDNINNVEQVIVTSTELGNTQFTVTVHGSSFQGDALQPWSGGTNYRQDFALFLENVVGQ
jgi:Subtilase family